MECKITNDLGTISITEDVLLRMAGYAALECYGIVAMSSKRAKDGIVEWLGRENLTRGVQLRLVEDGSVDIDLYIVVEYGISIVAVCNNIVDTVKYKIESMTGAKVRTASPSLWKESAYKRRRQPRWRRQKSTACSSARWSWRERRCLKRTRKRSTR